VQRLFSKGGWTRIKNTLLEALISNKTRLSKNEMQVVFAIVRKTWGYGKWSDRISRTQIQKITHLDLAVISHALKSLRERGILRKCQDYSYKNHTAYEWRIEDETDNWSQKSASSEDSSPMIKCTRNQMRKRPEQPMRNHLTTKESLSKDKIKYGQTSKAHTQNSVLEEDGVRYSI
jgi:phage replication O-like protein O